MARQQASPALLRRPRACDPLACKARRSRDLQACVVKRPHTLVQFRCSLLGRRFPALRAMKQEQLRELILDSRRATGKKLPVEPRRWPKSREQLVSRLAFTHSDASGRCKGAPAGRHHDKVVRAVVCKPGEARAPQRANPVWQTTGKVYDGRRDWVATGRLAARDGMDRNARQVRRFGRLVLAAARAHAQHPPA